MRRKAGAVALGGLFALGTVLLVTLARSSSRVASDNQRLIQIGVVLTPGQEACQAGEYLPSDAGRLRVWVSTAGKPGSPLALTVRSGAGAFLARGRTLAAYRDSPVDLSVVGRSRPDIGAATICLRDAGSGAVAVMGSISPARPAESAPSQGPARRARVLGQSLSREQRKLVELGVSEANGAGPAGASVDGRPYPQPIQMRLEWHRSQSQSWFALAPTIARRMTLERASFSGSWTFWLVIGIMAAAVACGAAVFVFELGR